MAALANLEKQYKRNQAFNKWRRHNQYKNFNSDLAFVQGNDDRTFHISDMAGNPISDITISTSLYGYDLLDRISELTPNLVDNRQHLTVGWINAGGSEGKGKLKGQERLRDQNLADDLTVIINPPLWNISNKKDADAALRDALNGARPLGRLTRTTRTAPFQPVSSRDTPPVAGPIDPAVAASSGLGLMFRGGRRKKTHRKRKHLKRKTLRKH